MRSLRPKVGLSMTTRAARYDFFSLNAGPVPNVAESTAAAFGDSRGRCTAGFTVRPDLQKLPATNEPVDVDPGSLGPRHDQPHHLAFRTKAPE